MKCMSASGQLGFGIPRPAFFRGIEKKPDFIGADLGSIDPGPLYLGSGLLGKSNSLVKEDLKLIIKAGIELGIPVVMGSAGTAGANTQVKQVVEIIKEIAKEENLHFDLGIITSECENSNILKKYQDKKLSSFEKGAKLNFNEDVIMQSKIVAQIGVEPFIEALKQGAQVVLAGRACDTSIFEAVPLMNDYDRGLLVHMAKIIECTSLCADPGGRDSIIATLQNTSFLLESQNPARKCTPVSVASHSLYEQSNPFEIFEPGGKVDLSNVKYEAFSDSVVRVSGSRWIPSDNYSVKLEGAMLSGYRSISLGGIRDTLLIAQVEDVCEEIRETVKGIVEELSYGSFDLKFRMYGINGTMGDFEFVKPKQPLEMMIITDVVAETQEIANSVCGIAKQNLLHYYYPGIRSTAGNLAIPFSPDVIDLGAVYCFSIYHLMDIDQWQEVSQVSMIKL